MSSINVKGCINLCEMAGIDIVSCMDICDSIAEAQRDEMEPMVGYFTFSNMASAEAAYRDCLPNPAAVFIDELGFYVTVCIADARKLSDIQENAVNLDEFTVDDVNMPLRLVELLRCTMLDANDAFIRYISNKLRWGRGRVK